jgi:hypothetical protein
MKTTIINITISILFFMGLIATTNAQDEATEEETSSISVGADLVSRYVWRGVDFGNTPCIQPGIEFATGGFSFGAWGSYGLSSNTGALEADLYTGYAFEFGLYIGVTDYYFPDETLMTDSVSVFPVRSGAYFDYDKAHAFEANVGYEYESFSISANYLFHNGNDDMYFELGYAFEDASIFVGGGNEAYTSDGEFNVCNVGISTSKDIEVSETFTIPVSGAFIVNPDLEQVHIVVGFTL